MKKTKSELLESKSRLHVRNKHRERYDLVKLSEACPELKEHVKPNKYGDDSIDFSSPLAVKLLNKALLVSHYNIEFWEIPEGYLCPPIPGRADYVHHAADLIGASNFGTIPRNSSIKCLDIGVGANCIYPIVGVEEYNWSFVGSEIDPVAIDSAKEIVGKNPGLAEHIEIRHQKDSNNILKGIIQFDEVFDLVICNPPFHATLQEAQKGNLRKLGNLNKKKVAETNLNFGGQVNELVTEGGERQFIKNYIRQSKRYGNSCFWFSTLVSKESNVKVINAQLKQSHATSVIVKPMGQGNKSSRMIGWTFLEPSQQKEWRETRWVK
ncbi:UNVERIFIED_CONTAM: hypothetical protein GTU68_031845 [Idotea baltica]|nr:hypothetical protein [Idotea baltica]